MIRTLWSYVSPPADISLVTFTVSGSNLKTQGSIPPKILGAKLQNLKNLSALAPSGYGFLQIPLLSVPQELASQDSQFAKRFQELSLKVKDVDVNALIRALQSLLSPSPVELQGQITELVDTVEISCQLVNGDGLIQAWRSTRKKDVPFQEEVTVDVLVDDILFQMLYDISREESLKRWRTTEDSDPFPNWQALQAFMRGLQYLRLYQQDLDYKALERAQNFLQRIQLVAPDNALGLYFYGISLAEHRKEAEAAEIFEQVRHLPPSNNDDESVRLFAQLQEASARLRHYIRQDAVAAVDLLKKLIEDLEKRRNAAEAKSSQQNFYTRLLTVAHAQLGYTYGTLIVLTEKPDHYTEAENQFQLAEQGLKDAQWRREEQNDAEFRINNARGYSLFRHAQLAEPTLEQFKEKCKQAIRHLEAARRLRPNHYEVLQNLAMIYDDDRYDTTLSSLAMAEVLYLQTARFVPKDYYQYERLARIQWRRMREAALPEQKKTFADEGRKWAKLALDNRSQSGEARLLLARFAMEAFQFETGNLETRLLVARQADAAMESALSLALAAPHLPVLTECEQFYGDLLALATLPAPDKEKFTKRHEKVKAKIKELSSAT